MMFRNHHLKGIREGKIKLAYRNWRKPNLKAGSTQLTAYGQLMIDEVTEVPESDITEASARESGFPGKAALLEELAKHPGQLYRIRFHYLGEDPRIALRENNEIPDEEMDSILRKLASLDKHSAIGPWTKKVLSAIERHPEERAADLAVALKMDKEWLKLNVRKLKNAGLTESLKLGYRLSPRGEEVLAAMKQR
jgi:hypothetical protein